MGWEGSWLVGAGRMRGGARRDGKAERASRGVLDKRKDFARAELRRRRATETSSDALERMKERQGQLTLVQGVE